MTSATTTAAPDDADPDLDFTRRIRWHRRKVPTVLQMEATECGAACLGMILAAHGSWVPLETLRIDCGVSRDGANARSIVEAARRYGFDAHGFSIELADLASEKFPVIAYWNSCHFVVIEGVSRRGVLINDPAQGRTTITWREADRAFTGLVLRLEPTGAFQRGGEQPRVRESLRWRSRGAGSGLMYLLVAGLALAVPTLLAPMALQEFVDQYLVLGLAQWAVIAALTMISALALSLWLTYWQGRVALHLTLTLSARQAAILVQHALALPISFYAQRYPGEVAARISLIDSVSQVVAQQLLPALLGLITSIAVAVALFLYSWVLAVIALGTAIAVGISLIAATPRRQEQALKLARDSAMLSGSLTYDLRSIDTVMATGAEQTAINSAVGNYARVNIARNRLLVSSAILGIIPGFATGFATALIIGAGGLLVINDELEVGQFVAVIALLPLFLSPLTTWVNAATVLQQVKAWVMRLDDILDHPVDSRGSGLSGGSGMPITLGNAPSGVANAAGLKGQLDDLGSVDDGAGLNVRSLELQSVTCRYAPGAADAVTDVSLVLEQGRSVALVGPSGSGKSTIARASVGLHHPSDGTVLINGSTSHVGWSGLIGQVGYIDQEIVLFKGTVQDNIAMFDESISQEQVKRAAQLACIDDIIERRPGGYSAELAEDGRNFSGGERQRIEIARVLVRDPSLIVLDEATSALDPVVERRVMTALRNTGAGLLVVAHRLSTVRECDEIIVLNRGRCVERGTHQELIALGGEYARLVGQA